MTPSLTRDHGDPESREGALAEPTVAAAPHTTILGYTPKWGAGQPVRQGGTSRTWARGAGSPRPRGPLPPRSPGLRAPPRASEKAIVCCRRPPEHKGPSFFGHWPLSPGPAQRWAHPSWHAQGLLLALLHFFCFFFFFLKKNAGRPHWAAFAIPPLAVSLAEPRALSWPS